MPQDTKYTCPGCGVTVIPWDPLEDEHCTHCGKTMERHVRVQSKPPVRHCSHRQIRNGACTRCHIAESEQGGRKCDRPECTCDYIEGLWHVCAIEMRMPTTEAGIRDMANDFFVDLGMEATA